MAKCRKNYILYDHVYWLGTGQRADGFPNCGNAINKVAQSVDFIPDVEPSLIVLQIANFSQIHFYETTRA